MIEKLKRALGEGKVFDTPEHLEAYARDESEIHELYLPDVVVHPETPEDVQALLRIAHEEEVPVVPRGAGTGLTGGALPVYGGIVVSFDRMNRIKEIDPENLIAVVEPGVITGHLQREVEALGLFYPPDPASLESCSLGGNIAEDAAGPRTLKYGVTHDYVLGLEVVIPGGERLFLGKRTVKGVTGYNVEQLIVGSEGTLAAVTEIVLKLIPKPPFVQTLLVAFPDEEQASQAVSRTVASGILPRTLEFMDREAVALIRPKVSLNLPPETGALLLAEADGTEEGVWAEIERMAEIFEQNGALEVLVAKDEKDRRELWAARRNLANAIHESARHWKSDDITVPRKYIPEIVRFARQTAADLGLRTVIFGHSGDGNLHIYFTYDDPEEARKVTQAQVQVFRKALSLGGTIAAEHGIGLTKKAFLSLEHTPPRIRLQKRLKEVFDPKGIMNPGKLFPEG